MPDIEQARAKTKAFLEGMVQRPEVFKGIYMPVLKNIGKFPSWVQGYLRDDVATQTNLEEEKEIDASTLTYRQALNVLACDEYKIPIVEEAVRREAQERYPNAFKRAMERAMHRWGLEAERYYAFIDALAAFAEGGTVPNAQIMRDVCNELRKNLERLGESEQEQRDTHKIPDNLFHKTFEKRARSIATGYILGGQNPLPEYITDDIRGKLDACKNGDWPRQLRHIVDLIVPLVAKHEKIEGADLRETADTAKDYEAHSQAKKEFLGHILNECTSIATDLGIDVSAASQDRPPEPPHRRRF